MFYEGLYNEAISYYQKAREKYQNSYRSICGLAKSYAKKADFKNAINYYKEAISIKETPDLLFELAVILEKSGDKTSAKEYYQRIKGKYPNFDRINLVNKALENL